MASYYDLPPNLLFFHMFSFSLSFYFFVDFCKEGERRGLGREGKGLVDLDNRTQMLKGEGGFFSLLIFSVLVARFAKVGSDHLVK